MLPVELRDVGHGAVEVELLRHAVVGPRRGRSAPTCWNASWTPPGAARSTSQSAPSGSGSPAAGARRRRGTRARTGRGRTPRACGRRSCRARPGRSGERVGHGDHLRTPPSRRDRALASRCGRGTRGWDRTTADHPPGDDVTNQDGRLARHVAEAADAWLRDPLDAGVYRRLVDATLAWRAGGGRVVQGLPEPGAVPGASPGSSRPRHLARQRSPRTTTSATCGPTALRGPWAARSPTSRACSGRGRAPPVRTRPRRDGLGHARGHAHGPAPGPGHPGTHAPDRHLARGRRARLTRRRPPRADRARPGRCRVASAGGAGRRRRLSREPCLGPPHEVGGERRVRLDEADVVPPLVRAVVHRLPGRAALPTYASCVLGRTSGSDAPARRAAAPRPHPSGRSRRAAPRARRPSGPSSTAAGPWTAPRRRRRARPARTGSGTPSRARRGVPRAHGGERVGVRVGRVVRRDDVRREDAPRPRSPGATPSRRGRSPGRARRRRRAARRARTRARRRPSTGRRARPGSDPRRRSARPASRRRARGPRARRRARSAPRPGRRGTGAALPSRARRSRWRREPTRARARRRAGRTRRTRTARRAPTARTRARSRWSRAPTRRRAAAPAVRADAVGHDDEAARDGGLPSSSVVV